MPKSLFSVALPSCTEGLCYPVPFSNLNVIKQVAQHAEALGYDAVWPNDHLATQQYVRERWATPPNYYDPFICLAFAADVTTTLGLGTGVTVLPMREPTVLAKQVMTLDHFSNGRVILGVGVGAYREEFEAVQPRMAKGANRGDMVTEGIQALRTLFTEHQASYSGKYWEFKNVEMYPKPVQPSLPIWVGGNSREGAIRAAQIGDGWLPASLPIPTVRQFVDFIHAEAAKVGRDGSQIEIAPQFTVQLGKTYEDAVAAFRQSGMYVHKMSLRKSTFKDQDLSKIEETVFLGTPDIVLEKIARYREAGVTHFCALIFSTNTIEEMLDQMQWFAEEVAPRV